MIEIESIDNCFFRPLTTSDVELGYAQRITSWRAITTQYRSDDIENALQNTWPLSSFVNAEIPIAIYVAQNKRDIEHPLRGFLEAKIHARDYAIVRQLVVFANIIQAIIPQESIEVVTDLLTKQFVQDCKDMQVNLIVLPRALNSSANKLGARYNFFTRNRKLLLTQWVHICMQLALEYPYLHLETPHNSVFMHVQTPNDPETMQELLANVLLPDPSMQGSFSWYRVTHVSLWHVIDTGQLRKLQPHEVDIIVQWQRKVEQHAALEMDEKSNIPIRLFGNTIRVESEEVSQLQVVAYRHIYRVPPHLRHIQAQPSVPLRRPVPMFTAQEQADQESRERLQFARRQAARPQEPRPQEEEEELEEPLLQEEEPFSPVSPLREDFSRDFEGFSIE